MKFKLDNKGVSEIIGTVLLLAIAITAFSVLAVYVFSNNGTTSTPHVNLVGYMDKNYNAIIENQGGDSLKLQNIRVVIWLGDVKSDTFSFSSSMLSNYNHSIFFPSKGKSMFYDNGNDKRWDVGDYIKIDCPTIFKDITSNISHWQISVTVIDKGSNSIIMSGILQQGILHKMPPIPIFTYSPISPKTPDVIQFNASQSYDPDGGSIVSYVWDFGDGQTGTGMVVGHKYNSSGNYTVRLTITDDDGQTNSTTQPAGVPQIIQVTDDHPPTGNFTWYIDQSTDGKINFISNASDPDGDPLSYKWYFGDGSTSSSADPSHIYDTSGNYSVTLIITDPYGASYEVTKEIVVPNRKPIPAFTYSPSNPNTKQYVFFDASSSYDIDGNIVNYSWDFNNDGIIDAYGVKPYHLFSKAGNYTVNLTVKDNGGATNYTTKIIQVTEPVTAPNFIIIDNTPTSPRNWDGSSRIIAAVQKLTSNYATGKAIDSWKFVGGTEAGQNITSTLLDKYSIVIWSCGDFPGDGAPAINDGNNNTWSTPLTEGYDDTSNHVYEMYQHLTHNGTLLLSGAYAARDLQDYPGNGANSDEIWLGNELGLNEPTGGINESLHSAETGHFATDYYSNSGTFSYGPIYAHGVINGIPGTSSDGGNIVITQDIPLYSLVKQNDSLYQYSLYATGGTPFIDGFESGNLDGWTIYNNDGDWYEWRVYESRYAHNGSYMAGVRDGDDDWLITPQITVPSGGSLDFWGRSYGTGRTCLEVRISTTGNKVSDFQQNPPLLYIAPDGVPYEWTHYIVNLTDYSGQQVYIAFHAIYAPGKPWQPYPSYLFIDDVKVMPSGVPTGYYAIDAVRGANRSIILGFDLNSPYITNESREAFIRNAVKWMAEGLGYATAVYVNNSAPPTWYDETHLHTIQEGIQAVTLGGTVYVYNSGKAYSPTIVNKSVDIIGIGNPVIDASDSDYGFKAVVDWVEISNFTIQGQNTKNGIWLYQSSSDTIKNVTISGCEKGISLYRSYHDTIEENIINSSSFGIYLYYSLDSTIKNNEISSNKYGIYASYAFLNNIQNNNISHNTLDGIYLDSSKNNTIWNNKIYDNGIAGIYLFSSTNKNMVLENEISNATYGVYLNISTKNIIANNNIFECQIGANIDHYSSQITIMANNIWNTTIAISIENSSSNVVSGNEIYSNKNGIKMYSSAGNDVGYNSIYNNTNHAILLLQSSNSNEIENNTIQNNGNGIYIDQCKENKIADNEIISNNETAIHLLNSTPSGYGNNEILRNNITGHLCGISLESSYHNLISSNNLYNNTDEGIYVASSNEVIISDNKIRNSSNGIFISRNQYGIIDNNTVYNTSYGIFLSSYSSENKIQNNTLYNNKNGIYMTSCNINHLLNNTIYNNTGDAIHLASSSNTNNINNNTIYSSENGILIDSSDANSINSNIIFNNTIGIHLISSGGTGNTILNNTIYSNAQYGIFLENSKASTAGNNEIIGNTIYNNGGDGIYLYSSTINSISQNTIYNNGGNGIYLYSSNSNPVSGNLVYNNAKNGIYTNSSDSNTIDSNIIYNNTQNGLYLVSSDGNRINNNTISYNNIGMYLYGSSEGDQYKIEGNKIWNNTIGVFLNGSDSNYFGYDIQNQIYNNTYGFYLLNSPGNHFVSNLITNNTYGILLLLTSNIEISKNYIENNSLGVYINKSSTNNVITQNNFVIPSIGDYGVYINGTGCKNNKIYLNNFINTTSISDSLGYDSGGGNNWYNVDSNDKEGNYWGNYKQRYPNATQLPAGNSSWYWSEDYEISGSAGAQDIRPLIAKVSI